MLAFARVQAEYTGDGVEHLRGVAQGAALFQPDVVVDAEPGDLGEFLPAQTGNPPSAPVVAQAHVLRGQPGPAGAKEVGEFCSSVHPSSITVRLRGVLVAA